MDMSSKKRVGVLINPMATHVGNPGGRQERLDALLRSRGIQADFYVGRGRQDSLEAARQMLRAGCGRLGVLGGDGTAQNVLPALMEVGGVSLAVFPLGTVNLLGLEYHLPRTDERFVEMLVGGKGKAVDVGQVNGQYFLQVAGAGLDANVLRWIQQPWHKLYRMVYLPAVGILPMLRTPVQEWEIRAGNRVTTHVGPGVLLANGAHYAGPFRLRDDVCVDDGKLDVFLLPKIPFWQLSRFLTGVLTHGAIVSTMPRQRASTLEIHCARQMPVHLDGEVLLNTPLRVSLHPKALEILLPP